MDREYAVLQLQAVRFLFTWDGPSPSKLKMHAFKKKSVSQVSSEIKLGSQVKLNQNLKLNHVIVLQKFFIDKLPHGWTRDNRINVMSPWLGSSIN